MSKATSPPSMRRFLSCLAETKSRPVSGSTTACRARSRSVSAMAMKSKDASEGIRASLAQRFVEQGRQLAEHHGLDEVAVEAGVFRALAIVGLAPAGDRDDRNLARPGRGAQLPADLVAVQAGQAEVEQDRVGAQRVGPDERLRPGAGDVGLVAAEREQQRQALGAVAVVVD